MARKTAKQVGALWRHDHEKVGIFLTGILDLGGLGEVPIAVFRNDRKEKGSKQPDYRIVLSERSGGGGGANGASESEPDPLAEGECQPADGEAQPAQTGDELPY